MPLLYSINGLPSVYPIEAIASTTASRPFSSLLSKKSKEMDSSPDKNFRHASKEEVEVEAYRKKPIHHTRKAALIAQDLMTSPVCCILIDLTLAKAQEMMQQKRFRHLPVVTQEGKLTGMLSDRDFIRIQKGTTVVVSSLMSSKVLTATPETSLQLIAESLLEHQIGALPIVNQDHQVVGILTTTDILRAIVTKAPIDLWV